MPDKKLYVLAGFDEAASKRMEDIGRALNQAGFAGKQTPGIPYHITMGSFETMREAELTRRLERLADESPAFGLSFNHIGLFGLGVLFLGPDVNRELLQLRESVCAGDVKEQDWTAHATLLIDEPEAILKALPLVAGMFRNIEARVESLYLYEFFPTRSIGEYRLKESEGIAFQFLDTGGFTDGEIVLHLEKTMPADEEKGFVPAYAFQICLCRTGEPVGEISLRVGYNENIHYGGNIGYSVYPQFRGNHYALKACRLLAGLARRHGMSELIITCNPDNMPSRRTCELLGAELREIVDLPPHNDMYREGERQKCRYILKV